MNLCKIQFSMVLLLMSSTVLAQSSQIGTVYPILETDALTEIQTRAQNINWQTQFKITQENVAFKSISLPQATENRVRQFIPWFTLEQDITNDKGQVLYPKSFTFNPLAYVRLPNRIIVSSPINVGLIQPMLHPTDMLLITEGDVLKVSDQLNRATFILDKKTKDRLGIEVQPAIIEQQNHYLLITEMKPEEENNG